MEFDKLIVRPNAKKHLSEIFEYYKDIDEELAQRFFKEVISCLEYIEQNPLFFQKRYQEIRICFTNVFPYGIYYCIKETPKLKKKRIYVLSILHTKRRIKYK
ncbi:type II toxin-antitoxin system RelE/ParE family toxin [Ornithobacterium rhinotracheale]|uniref:type II toxin-antitoxin system RelE/ParE family toxin n=1 Tax=Ornithobacterium rhinotracheale TaxID=28251 RepID=UPI00129CFDEB|nr:type II toxin-antitoxin system RelE/ParE family toxin [Ornithobacterium rhinotracheale]MRI64596.1 type II toxin-antitoxin system RelE/ParE family toxin [Ornithobacterium rhinotracheale]MRJ11609.1 type II toxin-antitoxin system RelE/ParE family toxin [Ornithobacterium rhinotracheale]